MFCLSILFQALSSTNRVLKESNILYPRLPYDAYETFFLNNVFIMIDIGALSNTGVKRELEFNA
jgi:hypothetical protein